MTIHDVAQQLVALCREGKNLEAIETLYADDVVSVEALDFAGTGREMKGKEAVIAKNNWWFSANELHSVTVAGPFVSPEFFAAVHTFDVTQKESGKRILMNEVGLYTVQDGKIVREEFLYATN
jgi:ketosteroid isomerase-like protein